MKTIFAITIVLTAVFAMAPHAAAQENVGTIVNVTQILNDRVISEQVCDSVEPAPASGGNTINGGTIIGGIAGALLGNSMGDGNGRTAMAALGAVTGAISGSRIANNTQPQQRSCRIVQRTIQQVGGYLVTYEYQGKTYQTSTSHDPSRGGSIRTVPVNVTVALR